MFCDALGNPVTLSDPSSLSAVNDFVEGVISCEARAVNILQIADIDPSAIVQAYCAALYMFAESRDAPAKAGPFLENALRAIDANPATTLRERRFVAAIAAWVAGDTQRAGALHEEQAREFPRDLASLKLGQYHRFNAGDAPGMLRQALAAEHAAADVPYFHGMLAFGYEQCHQLEAAETSAHRGIQLCRKEPWAHHAVAHVMLTKRRNRDGHAFMTEMSDTWTGLNSFMLTHNWWHQALFAIELKALDEALRLYDERVWGVVKSYSQDQVNAVSLLSRLELCGVDVGERWQDVAVYLETRAADQVSPFLDLHYLYGLARAGKPQADELMQNIEANAQARALTEPIWQRVAVPAARGLLAHARGNFNAAADCLVKALPEMNAVGGSHAQRDWFEQVYQHAAKRRREPPHKSTS
jgi:tetratricopeptide (TPR) repeat protein